MVRYTLKMDSGKEIDVHHYQSFDVKPKGVRCETCKVALNLLECIQVTPKGRTSGPWFCEEHRPLQEIVAH
jgi:hypothetical protein